MTTALQALMVAGVWVVVCVLFATGAIIVQATRETIREHRAREQ